jgi:hypothetical protein
MNSKNTSLTTFFQSIWTDYLSLNPDAKKIYELFSKNDCVVNDHIALRTFGIDGIRVEDLAKPLIDLGYNEVQSYDFKEKCLRAKHYAHKAMPLIFISELKVENFSSHIQQIISDLVKPLIKKGISDCHFLYSGRHWNISTKTYNDLLAVSEYAAWMAAFGYRPNHFTISINHLKQFKNIQSVNDYLKKEGFLLNTSGGIIKGSADVYLEQSSTMANKMSVSFSDQSLVIPSCFYEFAYRYSLPNGKLFKGFVANSADKIFESTHQKNSVLST